MTHRQNYVERTEQNKQRRIAAGLLSERYPEVSDIVLHMTYYQQGVNPVLMVRIVNFFPTDHAYFNMDCMIKGCMDGGFDLTKVVKNMIKQRKRSGKGKMVCHGKGDSLPSDHASIDYHITIKYRKAS